MAIGYISFDFPGIPDVRCIFQTREGGSSKGEFLGANISHEVGDAAGVVASNRTTLMQQLGVMRWGEIKQVHGDIMVFDPESVVPDMPGEQEADGSATDISGLALVIKTADCQPILLAHSSGKYIAALHAGWRGNRIGFPQSGVASFCARYGIAARDVMAVRGPSLGPGAAEFQNFATEWGDDWAQWFTPATRTMNLWELTRHQLREAGLPDEHIFSVDMCTWEHHDKFFSYRRSNICGRQASLIWKEGSAL